MLPLESNELDADELEAAIAALDLLEVTAVRASARARLQAQLDLWRESEFEDAPTRFAGMAEPRETVVG